MAILLALVFIAIIAIEVPGLVKKKMWRELTVFSVLLVIGMVLSFGQLFNLPLPNPAEGIEAIFQPVTNFLNKLFR